jgi:outer membrane protein assembly factor BamE
MYRSTPLRLARQTLVFASAVTALAALTALSGCQSTRTVTDKIRNLEAPAVIYKMEVVQGNFVSSEQVAALRAGMPKAQVKNILGTPLLTDIFHLDRWDYVFTISRDGKTQPPRKLTVFFKGESLDRWEGDTMPSETEFVTIGRICQT